MTLHRPLFMQAAVGDTAIEYDGQLMRLMLTGTWSSEGPVNNSFPVAQRSAGANMSVDVAGGTAIVTGNDVSLQGTYMCVSDANTNVTVPAAPATGTRTHRIMLYVKDALHDGTLPADTYEFSIELQEDTGSGTPALPPSAISLALVEVSAGQISVTDANITDTRISAMTAPSWLRQVASTADRPAIPLDGEQIWRTDLGDMETYDGTTWRRSGLNPPYAILRASANQNISSISTTAVAFDTEVADSHGGHDNATNNSRYTAPQAGVYRVSGVVPYTQNTGTGKYELNFRVNGSTLWVGGMTWKGSDNVTPIVEGTALLELNAGDYVELVVWHGTGTTRATDASFYNGPRFEIEWVRSL